MILLVDMLSSEGGNDEDRILGVLEMYEAQRAVEAAGRTAAVERVESKEPTSTPLGPVPRLARFLCPYHGLLRVRDGAGPSTACPHDPRRSPTLRTGGETTTGAGRFFLALGDPREGMRSPCTLTIKVGTVGASASVLPVQVRRSDTQKPKFSSFALDRSKHLLLQYVIDRDE